MSFWEKLKNWFKKNKKKIIIGTSAVLVISGSVGAYVIYKDKKMKFPNWLKSASNEELDEAYEICRLEFCKTGIRSYEMNKINEEISARSAKEWLKNPNRNTDPNYRWTDKNRWEKD